jgi:tetratricopeptide (TPR) repeat protein
MRVAREHYDVATRYYRLAEYENALKEFRAAYLAVPDPAFLFDIGQAYRMLGDAEGARKSYRAFLKERPDASNRADIEQFIREAEEELRDPRAAEHRRLARHPVEKAPGLEQATPRAAGPGAPASDSGASTPAPARSAAVSVGEQPGSPAPAKPLYTKGWFWGAMGGGAVVVGGAVAVGAVLGLSPLDAAVPSTSLGSSVVRFP